jgi:translation elongation factor EF-1alpha
MSLPKINLVVIGHKDHGKSTLIGRLLYDSQSIHPTKLQEIKHELAQAGSTTFELSTSCISPSKLKPSSITSSTVRDIASSSKT